MLQARREEARLFQTEFLISPKARQLCIYSFRTSFFFRCVAQSYRDSEYIRDERTLSYVANLLFENLINIDIATKSYFVVS